MVLYAADWMAQVVTRPVKASSSSKIAYPNVIHRDAHNISRADIGDHALRVLDTLLDAGYESYLVGGGVRDFLLGQHPKDFDVATEAEPDEVKRLFDRCRLIGRRFRLAHVRFGREVVEVATFRAGHDPQAGDSGASIGGRIVRDNVFGTLEEDAWRRDFTVNSLYFDVRDASVLDFTGGMADLEAGVLRMIGDPEQRYREDPVRMLRAIRFAAKLEFDIDSENESLISTLGPLLKDIPAARLFDEVLKLFLSGRAQSAYQLLSQHGVFKHLFPETAKALSDELAERFVVQALINTDKRLAQRKPVTPGFLFAALLWAPMKLRASRCRAQGLSEVQAVETAGAEVISEQCARVAFPRRFAWMAREIWEMQGRLERPRGKRALQLLERPRFRAAYDFLLLRAEAGEEQLDELVDWWTRLQELDHSEQLQALNSLPKHRRRRRSPRDSQADSATDGAEPAAQASRCYIGLGSNLDNPVAQLWRALGGLAALAHTSCLGQSSFYRNPPLGPPDQPDYVNAVAVIDTRLSPLALLDALQKIEQRQGRTRDGARMGPRTLDLDVLLYGGLILNEARLTIPHHGISERSFVLGPLHEVAPELQIPGLGPVQKLLERVSTAGLAKLVSE